MNNLTHLIFTRARPRIAVLMLTWIATMAVPAVAADWNAPGGGSADIPTNWIPAVVPGPTADLYFGLANTYTVTFPATVAASNTVTYAAGNTTFNINSPHTTKEFLVGNSFGNPTLTVGHGRLNTDYLNLGNWGSLTRLTLTGSLLTGAATLHTWSKNNRYYGQVGGDVIGYNGGITYLEVFGGAQYICERSDVGSWPMQMGKEAAAIATISVAGLNQNLMEFSSIRVIGGASNTTGLVVGASGTVNLYVYNGGVVDVDGNVMIGQNLNSAGFVTVGPTSLFGQSTLRAGNHMWIGYNDIGPQAGHAELTVKGNAAVKVAGRCDVGDPDNDASSFLRVIEGSTFRVNGGIKFWPTAGNPLDLRGGLTHVRGGAFLWPAGKALSISSTVGNPVLAISNGVSSTGPNTSSGSAQLTVGRGGMGTLRLTQPGTVLAMGHGNTTVADSSGSNGTVIVDSLATFTSGGPVIVGLSGNGALHVRGGALFDAGGALVMAAFGGSSGLAVVHGSGTFMQVRDNVWIGGTYMGGAGPASVDVDSFAVFSVLYSGPGSPAETTVFSTGSLKVGHQALMATTRDIVNHGGIYLNGGDIAAASVVQGTGGYLLGRGRLMANLDSSGWIVPGGDGSLFGRILVDGSVNSDAFGHYQVDLLKSATLQCDTLVVNGPATIAGTLEVTTYNGAPYLPGDVVTILSCTALTGTFNTVLWNGAPLLNQAKVLYDANSVRILFPGGSTPVDPGQQPARLAELRFAPANSGGERIAFALELPVAAEVQVKVYDIRGREMSTLQSGSLDQGSHRLLGESGSRGWPSGIYFARAVVHSGAETIVRTARTVIVH